MIVKGFNINTLSFIYSPKQKSLSDNFGAGNYRKLNISFPYLAQTNPYYKQPCY